MLLDMNHLPRLCFTTGECKLFNPRSSYNVTFLVYRACVMFLLRNIQSLSIVTDLNQHFLVQTLNKNASSSVTCEQGGLDAAAWISILSVEPYSDWRTLEFR